MTCFRLISESQELDRGNFAASFVANSKLQEMLKGFHKNVKILPFEAKRDMHDIRLLYPAWTARELGMNQNIKSNLSRLHRLSEHPEHFITCLVNGEICFILGYDEDENQAHIVEVFMFSGKPLKTIWGHKFADIFSFWLCCLAKTFHKYFILASCDKEVELYNKFTQSFGFSFWQEYLYNNRAYNLYIFNERV